MSQMVVLQSDDVTGGFTVKMSMMVVLQSDDVNDGGFTVL